MKPRIWWYVCIYYILGPIYFLGPISLFVKQTCMDYIKYVYIYIYIYRNMVRCGVSVSNLNQVLQVQPVSFYTLCIYIHEYRPHKVHNDPIIHTPHIIQWTGKIVYAFYMEQSPGIESGTSWALISKVQKHIFKVKFTCLLSIYASICIACTTKQLHYMTQCDTCVNMQYYRRTFFLIFYMKTRCLCITFT